MIVQNLGEIEGSVLVFGGIYSNLQALDAMMDVAGKMGISPTNMICTGDLVAYCADGAAVAQKMHDLGITSIKGNCEVQLAEDGEDCGCGFDEGSTCSLLSRSWYEHARKTIAKNLKNWMGTLPDRIVFEHLGKRYGVVHGGASDISQFIWPVTDQEELHNEISVLESQLGRVDAVLAGHSGIPMQAQIGETLWTNSGAIGMPANNGRTQTSFVLLTENGVKFHSLDYNVNAARSAMEKAGLTQGYHDSLVTGYWPSQETLPPIMRVYASG